MTDATKTWIGAGFAIIFCLISIAGAVVAHHKADERNYSREICAAVQAHYHSNGRVSQLNIVRLGEDVSIDLNMPYEETGKVILDAVRTECPEYFNVTIKNWTK